MTAYFLVIRYFLVYHFDSLISCIIYFPVLFLVVAPGIAINVLVYNKLVRINTNLASIIYKSFTLTQASVSSPGHRGSDQRRRYSQHSGDVVINQ